MAKARKKSEKAKGAALSEFTGGPCPIVLHPALRGFLTYRFYKTALKLRADVNDALAGFGLLGVQLGILRVLREGPVSQVELGRSLGIDKASMVKLLDGIEELGLVERRAGKEDRREKRIHVTAAGLRMIEKAGETRQRVEDQFLSPLSAAERKQFEALLVKLTS